eukprot:358893-Chlamydomonas_euryale.AAC.5
MGRRGWTEGSRPAGAHTCPLKSPKSTASTSATLRSCCSTTACAGLTAPVSTTRCTCARAEKRGHAGVVITSKGVAGTSSKASPRCGRPVEH